MTTTIGATREAQFGPVTVGARARAIGEIRPKFYETIARYLLGLMYLHGAVDGFLQIVFGVYYTGHPPDGSFTAALEHTTYFWVFLKLCEFVGAISLLANIKPVLGFAIVSPISVVMCLYYVLDGHFYIFFGLVSVTSLILLRAYGRSLMPLLDDYS